MAWLVENPLFFSQFEMPLGAITLIVAPKLKKQSLGHWLLQSPLTIVNVLALCVSQVLVAWGVSVQFSGTVVSSSLWAHGLQHARLPWPSPSPGVCPGSCPSHWWCHPATSSSRSLLPLGERDSAPWRGGPAPCFRFSAFATWNSVLMSPLLSDTEYAVSSSVRQDVMNRAL